MLLSFLILAGCGETIPAKPTPQQALALKPADPRLEIIPDPP